MRGRQEMLKRNKIGLLITVARREESVYSACCEDETSNNARNAARKLRESAVSSSLPMSRHDWSRAAWKRFYGPLSAQERTSAPGKMSCIMKAMISQVTSQAEAGLPGAGGSVGFMDPRVRTAIAYMEENYQRDLSLEKLAQYVNLSIWHFGHLFKTATGKSPVQYLKAIRMERARKLLETTFLSVKEVMSKVGMRDQTHFAKDFKRAYGLTPSRYRASVLSARRDGVERPEGEDWANRQLSLLDVKIE